jgi:hypothetical protein
VARHIGHWNASRGLVDKIEACGGMLISNGTLKKDAEVAAADFFDNEPVAAAAKVKVEHEETAHWHIYFRQSQCTVGVDVDVDVDRIISQARVCGSG